MTTDYTRGEADIIVDLIRQDNQRKPLTSAQVTFGVPNVFIPRPNADRNTMVVVTARPNQTFEGSYDYYYNRRELGDFVDPRQPAFKTYVIDGETRLSELLPRINARMNINLTVDKIFDADIPDFDAIGSAGEDIELKVTSTSLVFLGSIMLHLKPEVAPLSSVIRIKRLTGLTYQAPA